jgi:hypothetical protein
LHSHELLHIDVLSKRDVKIAMSGIEPELTPKLRSGYHYPTLHGQLARPPTIPLLYSLTYEGRRSTLPR